MNRLRLFGWGGVEADMRLRLGLLAVMVLVGVGSARAQRSVAEQYLFTSANAERAQAGLRPLRWDEALYRAADGHAREMASRRSISHQYAGEAELSTRGKMAGVRFSVIAENVAESPNAVRMQDAWMHSPGHRANLLDPQVDAVGIRVINRDGQLYAVEDFARVVTELSLEEQESAVEAQLRAVSEIAILPASEDSRRTCSMQTGYAGSWQPGFVMRFNTASLDRLPEALKSRVASGRFRQAAVGACPADGGQDFATFSIAVMLFP